jgi:NADH:ubiquinone oxidoreductase subunit 4 (subunit M)
MLRAYRSAFMGTMGDRCKGVVDLRVTLRVPVTLLVASLLWLGFFPQSFVRVVSPAFRDYFNQTQPR